MVSGDEEHSDHFERVAIALRKHYIDVLLSQHIFQGLRPRLKESPLSVGVFTEDDRRALVNGVEHFVMRHFTSDEDICPAAGEDTGS